MNKSQISNTSDDYSKLKPENMAVCIVLYNPTRIQLAGIKLFKNFKLVIVVDNSQKTRLEEVNKIINGVSLSYSHHPENIGLSKAYNLALDISIKSKIDYLMLVDQDSEFDINTINKLSQEAKKLKLKLKEFAILGFSWYQNLSLAPRDTIIDQQLIVFSSGSVLRVAAIKDLGGFDDRFFVDSVDAEISLKAIRAGYKTGKILNLGFIHNIGHPKEVDSKLFKRKLNLYNHSPVRRYYQIRNALLINKLFAGSDNPRIRQFVNDIKNTWVKDQIRTLFYEKNKASKIYYSGLGYLHFKLGRFKKL